MSYTHRNLEDVEDSAVDFGFSDRLEARFARKALEAQTVGVALQRFKPNMKSAFGHRHDQDEEIYVVIGGSGRMRLGDEVIELGKLDAVRVAPEVVRAFEAGPDGLDVLAFGTHHEGDGELVKDFWNET